MNTVHEVREHRVWLHTSGATASLHGSVPYGMGGNKDDWSIVQRGWTVHNTRTGTSGIGRQPCATREEAEQLAAKLNEARR